MGKILPKRKLFKSSIFTPRLDGISHIDNVRASLDTLIFSNEREVEKVLFKKRIKVVVVMTIILMIVGYFLSPKGKADVATFYPTACLGGWNNPRNAEGEPQTTRNDDVTQFTNENSAVLASSTHADMYCGSFVGAIEKDTVPKKILVSIAWSTGSDIPLEKNISSPTFSSSSMEILDTASTTQVSFTLASSTEEISTSSPSNSVSSSTDEVSTTTEEITEQATTTENATQSTNLIEKVLDKAGDVLETIFGGGDSATVPVVTPPTPQPEVTPIPAPSTAETPAPQSEVTPTPAPSTIETPAPAPAVEGTPSSFLQKTFMKIVGNIFESVFAEEGGDVVMESNEVVGATTSTEEITPVVSREIEQMIIEEVKKDNENTSVDTGSTSSLALSFDQASTSESTSTDYIEVATTSDTETTPSYQSQNNFLEVLYTFDGITWNSLGEVNEESIKYRTFEIPVTASTTWSDMGQLQIKVQPVQRIDATPTVYLDAIKVEVLYESPLTHTHPDFKRDTILQDETIDGVRILRIINNDTNEEEVWYMHVEEVPTATTTVEVATTTDMIATSTTAVDATSTVVQHNAPGTEALASSTPRKVVRPNIPKNTWLKFNGEVVEQQGIKTLLKQIEEQEEKMEFMYPDFAKDLIKKIGGSYVSATIVQIEQEGIDSLWLFDNEKNTKEKIDKDGVTTISKRYPFGIKGGSVYWLSEDETMVYRYTIDTKVIDQKEIPPHDVANGERGEVMFENSLWKVYVGADAFSFSSEETGEIFSDDNLTVGEAFRIKEKLDLMISKEKLEELNFVTEDQPQ